MSQVMTTRRIHNRDMSGKNIPHTINPGPQVGCSVCGLLRFGADFATAWNHQPCRYCVAGGVK